MAIIMITMLLIITTIDNLFTMKNASAQTHVGTPGNDRGNNRITGDPNSFNDMYGDAFPSLPPGTQGGNDQMIGGSNSINQIYGDSLEMNSARGGNDQIIGGSESVNFLVGDASQMSGGSKGETIQ